MQFNNMDTFFLLFITTCCFYFGSATLSIKELVVPDSIKSGSTDEVVLDCDFEALDEEGVVLKWFYNGEIEQIYQWIPDTKTHGYASGRLKNNIDLAYKVSDDENAMYRALRIKDISPEMSGNYTCKVSSYEDEVSETKQLIIYTPAQSGLDLILIDEEEVVICSVNGIYPRPTINLYIDGGNETMELDVDETEDLDENGLYNITTILKFDSGNLTNPTKFICDLNIPGTNYSLTNNVEHYIEIEELSDFDLQEDNYDKLNNSVNSTEEINNIQKDNSGITSLPPTTLFSTIILVLILVITN